VITDVPGGKFLLILTVYETLDKILLDPELQERVFSGSATYQVYL